MSWRDVRRWYEDPPDDLDLIDEQLRTMKCEWDLAEVPCEECKDGREGHDCYFHSDGGYEPRDGHYLCLKCSRKRFQIPEPPASEDER